MTLNLKIMSNLRSSTESLESFQNRMGVITNANILRIKRFRITNWRRAYRHIRTRRLHHPRTNSLYTLRQRNTSSKYLGESSLFTTTTFSPLINIVK
jgi:hypothetical protein